MDELRHEPDLAGAAILTFGTESLRPPGPPTREARLESPEVAARRLYEVLHEFDGLGLRAIVVIMPPDRPEWLAIRDRLLRATQPL
jgi:L-threonylcarbamoyladenylate synthase